MKNNACTNKSMTQRQFIAYIANMAGVEVEVAKEAYEMVVSGIKQAMSDGFILKLYGFGHFYPQLHRGHQMQFSGNGRAMGDYLVVKFSAAGSLNRRIRNGEPVAVSRCARAAVTD